MKHDQVCNRLEFVSNTDVDLDEIDEIKTEDCITPSTENFVNNEIVNENLEYYDFVHRIELKELPVSDTNENFITTNHSQLQFEVPSQSISNQISTKPLCTIC